MRGAIPHSPNTPSWHGAQCKGTTLPLPDKVYRVQTGSHYVTVLTL